MLKFKYLRKKRPDEGNPRGAMHTALHSNLLEVGNLRRPRVAVCSFLFSENPRNQPFVPACQAWRGRRDEVRRRGEPPRARRPPQRFSSSFGGNFLAEAPPPSPRKPVSAVVRAIRVSGAPGGGGSGWQGGACWGRGRRRWRPWGRSPRVAGQVGSRPCHLPAQTPWRVRAVGRGPARDLRSSVTR